LLGLLVLRPARRWSWLRLSLPGLRQPLSGLLVLLLLGPLPGLLGLLLRWLWEPRFADLRLRGCGIADRLDGMCLGHRGLRGCRWA
jgi:hypothetical protein